MSLRSPRALPQRRGWSALRGATGTAGTGIFVARRVVWRLTVLYVAALALIALIVLGYARTHSDMFEPHLAADLTAVDLVKQQEESSQRLARDALATSGAIPTFDAPERAALIEDMSSTLARLEANQAILRGTSGAPGLRGLRTGDLDAKYATVEPLYQTLVNTTATFRTVLASAGGSDASAVAANLALFAHALETQGQAFEADMEEIGNRYSEDGHDILAQEEVLDKALAGLTLFALLLVGALVFFPATRQVGRSIDELAKAEEQQRELAALKDQFIIYANHELRTPIMALYSSLELLEAVNQRGDDPERRTRLLRRALTSGNALIRLLQSVLDTGVVEAQTPRVELVAVPLAPVIHAVLETFDPREVSELGMDGGTDPSRTVRLDVPADLVVLADEGRLRQVLINLLSNALKYSAAGTPIVINAVAFADQQRRRTGRGSWLVRQRRGGAQSPGMLVAMARVSVRDQGLGVSPRDVSKLFNRFVRLERDIAGNVRGAGVGLYLCRMLVEAMGGRIWVESNGVPGEGSVFSFTLPLAVPTEQSVRTAEFAGALTQREHSA
jgi:signal transduction histidine kinase